MEGDIAMHALRIPGTSFYPSGCATRKLNARHYECRSERVFSQKFAPLMLATDGQYPQASADNFIILKSRDEWPKP